MDGMLVHFRVPPTVFKLAPKRETMEQTFFYKKTMLLHSQGLNLCLQIQSPMC